MSAAVIFDLFHTLVSPEDMWPAGFNRERAAAGALGIDPVLFEAFWRNTGRSRYTGASVARLLESAADVQGAVVTEGALEAALELYGRYHDLALASPRPEVTAGLAALRDAGHSLALLSNADDREVARWSESPLARLISTACFSFQIGVAKPDPGAYTTVLSRLDASARSIVYVGDGGSSEFEGARRAGIQTIVCVTGFGTPGGLRTLQAIEEASHIADHTVSSVADVASYVG